MLQVNLWISLNIVQLFMFVCCLICQDLFASIDLGKHVACSAFLIFGESSSFRCCNDSRLFFTALMSIWQTKLKACIAIW